jgi:hypothetical protein
MIHCEKSRGAWKYTSEGFSFKLIDEKLHDYKTLIVTPKHIKVLSNTSEMTNKELKNVIIETMFAQENADVREHNNKIAKIRRMRKK